MKLSLRVAMVCFLISVAISLGFYFAGEFASGVELGGLWKMFLLLVAIAMSLYLTKRAANFEQKTFVEDLKVAMQGGIVFVVLISLFTYVFHSSVDTSYVDKKLTERLEYNLKNVPNEKVYKEEVQANDPSWKDKSYLDFLENQEDQAGPILSAKSLGIGHLGLGVFLTFFFSIAATFVIRKIVLYELN